MAPMFKGGYTDLDVFSKDFENRWLNPGDELKTDIKCQTNTYINSDYKIKRTDYDHYICVRRYAVFEYYK